MLIYLGMTHFFILSMVLPLMTLVILPCVHSNIVCE